MEIKNDLTDELTDLEIDCDKEDKEYVADPFDVGKFLTKEEAICSLQEYFAEPGVPRPDDNGHIYGHTFGLKNLRELLTSIDEYNIKQPVDDCKVRGIRVYYGKSVRRSKPEKGMLRDVFLMPVKANNCDLFEIYNNCSTTPIPAKCIVPDMSDKLILPPLILGESRPCPNQCKKKKNK